MMNSTKQPNIYLLASIVSIVLMYSCVMFSWLIMNEQLEEWTSVLIHETELWQKGMIDSITVVDSADDCPPDYEILAYQF